MTTTTFMPTIVALVTCLSRLIVIRLQVSAQCSPGGSHAVKDGAVELQRVLDNVAIHAGSCEMPQVVFDSTAVASQVEVRHPVLRPTVADDDVVPFRVCMRSMTV